MDVSQLPTLVTALCIAVGQILTYVNSRASLKQGQKNGDMAVMANRKTDSLIQKTDEIHILTNSNLTKIKSDLDDANAKIASLEDLVSALVGKKV